MKPFFGLPLVVDSAVALDSIPEDAQRKQFDFFGAPAAAHDPPAEPGTDGAAPAARMPPCSESRRWTCGRRRLEFRVRAGFAAANASACGRWRATAKPTARAEVRSLCALRTAQTATHETGHMFGIRHCIAYECGMNGSNHAEERDRQPLEFCPECQAKLWWTLAPRSARSAVARSRPRRVAMVSRRCGEAFAAQAQALAPMKASRRHFPIQRPGSKDCFA